MTKEQAQEIKKAVFGKYKTYYSSKKASLSVRVYSYVNNSYNPAEEEKEIKAFLEITGVDKYEIKRRTYQGFIHDTDIILS